MQISTITLFASSNSIGIGGISVISPECKNDQNNLISCPTLNLLISDLSIVDYQLNPNPISWFITGKSNGIVDIYVDNNGITSNHITITVTGSSLHSIEIDPKITDINVGKTLSFSATCKDQNNDTIPCIALAWKSDNTSVGTIDQNGKFIGISKGTTNITASIGNITSDNAIVTVSPQNFGDILLGGLIIGVAYVIFRSKKTMQLKKTGSISD